MLGSRCTRESLCLKTAVCSAVVSIPPCAYATWLGAQHILVSDVVRQLACGAGFDFFATSVVKLKGCKADMEVHELGVLRELESLSLA